MKRLDSTSHLVARVGLVVGLVLLAGVLLRVSIAVSAAPAHPATVGAGLALVPQGVRGAPAPLGASAPAPQAAPAASAVLPVLPQIHTGIDWPTSKLWLPWIVR